MRRFHRFISRKPLQLVLVVALAAGLFMGVGARTASAACDAGNDIMKCGFTSPRDFANTANGSSELKHIYSAYGLEPAEYDKFVTHSVQGLAYKDNTIRVNGRIVARDVDSIGRNKAEQGSGAFTQTIPGAGTYYGNTNDKAFATGPLPVTVLLDDQGKVQFAVINSCGNPVGAPNYRCNTLHVSPVSGTTDSFKFSSNVTANSTAKVKYVVYDFGDGVTLKETDPTLVVTHKYKQSKTFTAKVTVYISLPHATDAVVQASGDCLKSVVAKLPPPPPVYVCVALDRKAIGNSGYNYQFIVTGQVANGARIASATFDFGDKTAKQTVPVNGVTVTTTHAYNANTKATYTAKATLNVLLPGNKTDTVTSSNCTKPVAVNTPLYACASMSGTLVDEPTHKYSFTVVADYNKFVSFQDAQFNFGDGSVAVTVPKGSDGKTETTTHAYQTLGNYTVTATLNFKDGKKVVSANCSVPVTPTQVGNCQTGDTQNNPQCNPCKTNPTVAANSPECALPNTGAGDVIGIAGVVAVLGFFVYRQFIYRRHELQPAHAGAAYHAHHAELADDNELTAQVITHHTAHRNEQGLNNNAAYHKPHRFRPRSHNDHHQQ